MRFAHRTLRAIGGAAMVGALVLGTATAATADATRDGQWQNKAFNLDDVHKTATGKGVTVAVLDDGVNGSQADLTGNVLPGKRCSDDQPANQETRDIHGTGMAALIAGHGHGSGNSQGVLGMAPDAKILPVDVFDRDGVPLGTKKTKACQWDEAIRYAVDKGADVINISVSQSYADEMDKAGIAYALAHNVVVVQASGNDGSDESDGLGSIPGVAQVGGSLQNGNVWGEANRSKQLMFTAPAKSITVPTPNGTYEDAGGNTRQGDYITTDGTSMSAAIASGTFALLKQKYPDYTPGQLVNRIIKTTYIAEGVDKSKLPDPSHGYGDLSPRQALTANVPKGGANGPWDLSALPKASGKDNASGGSSSSGTDAASNSSSDSDSSNTMLYVGIGIAALVVIVVVVVIVILVSRNKNNRGGPGGPGAPGTMPPPYQHQGGYPPQPQQPNPYGQQQPPQWGPPRQ
ncbi:MULTISPECIES: S8 family serine peptidase [unclassified Streptomyces]|uniref:S8 family serine peptidase n=1 Tax=unclassified Streptomyces TaxID=2593676 RepID=UPI00278C74A0|nr:MULTISPECIES: S8 family serine peptidase [unclassified Streptomyces]